MIKTLFRLYIENYYAILMLRFNINQLLFHILLIMAYYDLTLVLFKGEHEYRNYRYLRRRMIERQYFE